MNTGLQDAYSLAWRLALNHQKSTNSGDDDKFQADLENYSRERPSIARSNAEARSARIDRCYKVLFPSLEAVKALEATPEGWRNPSAIPVWMSEAGEAQRLDPADP